MLGLGKKTIKKLITHNGSFHADDIFACATLSLMLEKKGEKFEIIRTRDEEIIKTGDYVFDVGGVYDEEGNRFDHHQKGGAGVRENGIEYASFGLVWKKYGVGLAGSVEAAQIIDDKLVAPIDASDNGINLVEKKYDIYPYTIEMIINAMRPVWNEDVSMVDEIFFKSVKIFESILKREIIHAQSEVEAKKKLMNVYDKAKNKSILVLENDFAHHKIFDDLTETYYVVFPRRSDGQWGIRTVRKGFKTFENKKDFPREWGGLTNNELQKITGVSDAVFCHRALFMAVAKTKEGAIKLAQIALES